VGLTAYRVVQEALTNAVKHGASGSADLHVAHGCGEITVEVLNERSPGDPGDPASGGFGLRGMRERVAMYGGELEFGPSADGRFRVRARLPLTEPVS